MKNVKTAQLQIRVSPDEKRAIRQAARAAGKDVSSHVLDSVLSVTAIRVEQLMRRLGHDPRYAFAELNDILTAANAIELRRAVLAPPPASLPDRTANYLAAMVKYACGRAGIDAPDWTRAIAPLTVPYFGSTLQSPRLHLLSNSPPPFRRRNIFIDTSLGGRV